VAEAYLQTRGFAVWVWADPPAETTGSLEQAQFKELVESVTDYAIFVLDADGYVQTWNQGARRIKGYDDDEIVGEHFSTFYTEGAREAGLPDRNLENAEDEGRVEDEGWRVRNDGSQFWANVTITALRDDDGTLQGFMKVTRDMTERHEYEERLRREKERFETLVREVKDYAIFLIDADGYVQTWNEGAKQLKGYDADEIVGEHFSTFYPETDREAGRPETNLAKAAEDGRVEDEGERLRKDGTTFWANVVITALYDDAGEVRGYAKLTRDMTERHEYEERLRDQRDELDELNQINAVIRDIDQALVGATTRDEIEQAVCDRLADSDTYTAAWIGEYTEDYEEITPRTWAGIRDEYLEAIREADAEAAQEMETGIGATAVRTRAVQTVQTLGDDLDGEPWRGASLTEGYESAVTVPLVYNEVEYGVLTVYADHESAFDQRKLAVMRELGETISHAIAAIRRKERERTLTALQESTRELLHAEIHDEIGDVIVETLTYDLALADALVYHFDTTENTLEPVSSSYAGEAYANQLAPLSAGTDSPVWTSFMEGDPQLADSVLPARELGRRRTMVVPLGDHGALAVAAAEEGTFDRNTRNLVNLVAATAEAAFDRVESQANLRERDELLQEQNQRLQRLNGINTIIREIDQGLVKATSRAEVERVVCDRLTASDRFRFAWIGRADDVDGEVRPRAWSGDDRGYLDSIDLDADRGTDELDPALTAAGTDEVAVVSNVADDLRGSPWRREAFRREFQSAISVPLRYGDVTYGVLTVYADQPDVFDEMERSVFAELGETIANTMHAVDTQQALVSEQVVELEFQLRNESTSFLARVAGELGTSVSFEGMVPTPDEAARLFVVVHGSSREEIADVLDRSVTVESHEVVASRDDGHLLEVVVTGRTVPSALADHGASLRELTVTEAGVAVTVDLPSSADVRGFIEGFQSNYESAEFIARRERDRPALTPDRLFAELRESLTDRQYEVLKTAYHSGYFASPRRSTGGEVADLLGVSQPTVTEQLRTAQCKILDLVFADLQATT
jgi:PAS domain S-box-containing protein